MNITSEKQTLDPVILALTQNRLDHISHQMGWVMVRTARSPIFSQAHDFSCFIAGPTGEVVSQADGIPIHTGSGGFGVRAILRDFGDELAEGDGVEAEIIPLRRIGEGHLTPQALCQ